LISKALYNLPENTPDIEMKDYEYEFGAASGLGHANVERPEKARESAAEWRLHQQQHGWGFGGGNRRGFGPSQRGGYGGQGSYVRGGGPRRPPHFQASMLGEKKGRYWGIPGSPLQGQVQVQDSSVAEYYNSPPRQQQQQQQQLDGLLERSHGGYGISPGPHQGAMHSIPISQAQAHRSVGGIGRVGVGMSLPAPLSTLSFPLDTTRYYLLGQLEYYLSPQNMAGDFYLRKQVCFCFFCLFFFMLFCFFFALPPFKIAVTDLLPPKTQQMDTRGWIPIPLIASFNRVRQLTADVQLIREVLTLSSVVQVCGEMVRMDGWESFVLPGAPMSEVVGEGEGGLGVGYQQPVQEEPQQR
jgi:hypothetical protein